MTIRELREKSHAQRKHVAQLKKTGDYDNAEKARANALCAENIVRRKLNQKAKAFKPIVRPQTHISNTECQVCNKKCAGKSLRTYTKKYFSLCRRCWNKKNHNENVFSGHEWPYGGPIQGT